MCDYCENKKQLMAKEVPYEIFGKIAGHYELQVIIDRGYLRIGDSEDMQCMDHGDKIKLNCCPICFKKFGSNARD